LQQIQIVRTTDIQDLVNQVNQHLRNGWSKQEPMIIDTNPGAYYRYIQLLMKESDCKQ